ncbi:hypothetical protein [Maridesulfovibrio sp.]|uniref:hypothetical protein n=1 Tax=Maridesulfovibrio sp. TaxID=2795000 RepID=UPI0029F4D9D7|nr:hypothetical protein [Maridesulfovibrio sp.]
MIDKASALETVLLKLKKVPVGLGLDMRTYKRDRSVLILRTGEDTYVVIEDGFEQARFDENSKSLKKVLKRLLKKEFPRSNKIRVYDVDGKDLQGV